MNRFFSFPVAVATLSLVACGSADEDPVDSSESALGCRDVSGVYRVVGARCWIGEGKAREGTLVTVKQAPSCSAIALTAIVEVPPPPPQPSGPSNPYDMCASLASIRAVTPGTVGCPLDVIATTHVHVRLRHLRRSRPSSSPNHEPR